MKFDNDNKDIAWCPGCGHFAILNALKKALEKTGYTNQETVLVSGIGQAAKAPQYINANYFNGLHGRAIPAATGIKASNKDLKVIVASGDGDIYGEGGNHFIHAIRRNPDITVVVFNNMVYGLTKGQASPTTELEFVTKTQPHGNQNEPFNPIAVSITQNISFAARAFAGDIEQTAEMIFQAITHKGFSLVDVLSPCVSFNKINTYGWFKQNTFYMENHDSSDKILALKTELENDKMPLGIFFKTDKVTFEESEANKAKAPLYKSRPDLETIINLY